MRSGARRPQVLSSLLAELRASLYLGKLSRGDKLPGIRQLARRLHASPMTVLDLYTKLQDEGFVEGRQRSGTYLKTLGVEMPRGAREMTLFRIVDSVGRKLRLLGLDPDVFSLMLRRYCGSEQRADFKFAFMASVESYEQLKEELRRRLRIPIPLVRLPPEHDLEDDARQMLDADRSVRCVLSPYVHSDRLFRIARAHHLYMIIMGLDDETAAMLVVPEGHRRMIVVGETDCADAIRRLVEAICEPEQRERITVMTVAHCGKAAWGAEELEVYASAACLEETRSVLPPGTSLRKMPSGYAQQAMESILFHYLFAA